MDSAQLKDLLWNDQTRQILLNLLYAAVILMAGLLASRLSGHWLATILDHSRIKDDLLLKNFFLRLLSLVIIVLAALTALSKIGWDVRTFIAGLGITGLIIGFGLKDVLSNFAAGLLLLIYRPFRAGQMIEVEGSKGVVQEITIVNMEMVTTDGIHVIMPNSKVWGARIINYSLSQKRRLELKLKVREEDIEHAIAEIQSALSQDRRILPSPLPSVQVDSIADAAAMLTIWAWTRPEDFQNVAADEYLRLQAALRDADISIL